MTVALMIGGDGAQWLSRVKSLSREVLGWNPSGAVSNLGQVRYPHVARDASSLSENDGSRSQTKGGRRHVECILQIIRRRRTGIPT